MASSSAAGRPTFAPRRLRSRSLGAALLGTLAMLAGGLPGSAANASDTSAALTAPTAGRSLAGAAWRLVPSARPGAVVSRGGIAVVVPRNGMGVRGDALMVDGTERGLSVRTARDGRVLVQDEVAPDVAVQPTSATIDAVVAPASEDVCADRAYHLTGTWWHNTTLRWSFRASSKPAELRLRATVNALKQGVADITREHNDCGRSDHVSATSSYLGTTSTSPNIAGPQTCLGNDGQNVVGFGNLDAGIVAFSCWWFNPATHANVEADMLLNKHDFDWTTTLLDCTDAYMVRAIATHEFGHIYGLAHVSEQLHPDLTMSTAAYACDDSPSTLGLGDMLGLERHY